MHEANKQPGELSRREFLRKMAIAGSVLAGAGSLSALAQVSAQAVSRTGSLMWYTSVPTEFSAPLMERFRAAYPGINAQFYYAQTGAVTERLLTEIRARRVLADAFLAADPTVAMDLARQGYLLRYESPEAAAYAPRWKDPDGYWVNARTIAYIFAYNHNIIPPDEAPKKWEDLTNPKWRGKLGLVDIRVGGTPYLMYYCLRKQFGVDFWRAIAANQPRFYRAHGQLMDLMLTGEIPISTQNAYYVWSYQTERQAPVTAVYASPTPVTFAPICIPINAPNVENGKLFVDWLLSREGQTELVKINGTYSARNDVEPAPGKPPLASLDVMDIDWDDFAGRREELTEEATEIFELG